MASLPVSAWHFRKLACVEHMLASQAPFLLEETQMHGGFHRPCGQRCADGRGGPRAGQCESPVASECAFPRVYAPLLEVWRSAVDLREARLREYAASWKKKISPIYWSNSLKGAEGAYFGYWCFDIALAVMLLDIPDAALRKSAYYPADWVDAARQAAP